MIIEEVENPNFDFKNPNLTIKQIWDLHLEKKQEPVDDIFEKSKQEYKMNMKLDEFDVIYKTVVFDYQECKS